MEKLVLIDGNSLINRAFYAMPPLMTKKGEYTNAVYGFMNMFLKMLSDEKPTAVVCAFDLKAPTFRHKIYAEYKGTRKPMPEELRPQIPLLKSLLTQMGVRVMEKEGSEADDIIGTIAKNTDVPTVIITGDRDALQLVDEQTEVHFTKRGLTDVDVFTNDNFKEKTELEPWQIIELKALMGDGSDNIPGVPGVGEKTAMTLLKEYRDIDTVYAHLDEIKGKLQEKLKNNEELCRLSKTLATIDTNCGVDTCVENMTVKLPFPASVKTRFAELEFKTLARKDELFEKGLSADAPTETLAEANAKDDTGAITNDTATDKPTDLSSASAPSMDTAQPDLKLDRTVKIDDLSAFNADALGDGTAIAFTKTAVHVYFDGTEYLIPLMQTLLDDGVSLSSALSALTPLLKSGKKVVLYDSKEFKHLLKSACGESLGCTVADVALMKYLADFRGGSESLQDVITEYGKDEQHPAFSLAVIEKILWSMMAEQGVLSLYTDMELPLSSVLFDMEEAGFKVNVDDLYKTGDKYRAFLTETEREIRALAGDSALNVNSPKQLGELLFDKLKIGKGKKTKTGYSTSAEILESLEDAHPIVPLILKYRRIQKLQSTYIEGFKPLIDKTTGLIHTSFNQTVTATGRLSSKEPNLQNIPVRDDEGKELRRFFVPRADDRILVSADYSQIELRLLAAFSGCKALIEAFNNGADVHADTASKVFRVPLSEVTPQMRSSAKAVNFGIIYGISEYGLAKNIKTSAAEARGYILEYFRQYPEVKDYMDDNVDFAKEHGYICTFLGRRRYIRELQSANYNLRQFGERVAMNMPLQGSSADIIKLAMLGVHKRLKEEKLDAQLILQVHDELIIDAHQSVKEKVEKILVEEMEGAADLAVKLTVGLGSGKTWFDAK